MSRRLAAMLILVGGLAGGQARGHFLFIRVGPVAEDGRWAEVFFSEQAEAGDPRFVDKIAHTRLWVQEAPGEFRPLAVQKGEDRLRARVPASGPLSVIGECEYGVIAREGETSFLLRHYPKAMAGDPEALNRLKPRAEIPLEVVPRIESGRIHLVALLRGKPLPGATFFIVDADLNEQRVTAGPEGAATWTPEAPGRYSIYTRHDTREPGEVGSKRYDEIREFATLALDWPLEGP